MIHKAWLGFEGVINEIIPSEYNPLYHLGAMGVFFLWVILFSGVYLFIFYEISVHGAYGSVEYITNGQRYFGGVARSLHRYASDGLIIVAVIHALRQFVLKSHADWTWIAWASGALAAVIIIAGGIFGYVLVWDEKAKLAATFSAMLLEQLPVFSLPLGLIFAGAKGLTDQFFYIVLFIHFSSIVFVFLILWVHLKGLAKARLNPPKPVVFGLFAFLLFVSIFFPASSGPEADLKRLPTLVSLDWFYMFFYPLLSHMSPRWVLLLLFMGVFFAIILPILYRPKDSKRFAVDLEDRAVCEMCGKKDCPYAAPPIKGRGMALYFSIPKITLMLFIMFLPVFYVSDMPYSFYPEDSVAIRVAFRHAGKRIALCGEEELKAARDRFRKQAMEKRGVRMELSAISKCPPQRHPLNLDVSIDDSVVLEKAYPPAGIRHDMASYAHETFLVKPGVHRVKVAMSDGGGAPYILEKTISLAPAEVVLIGFDGFVFYIQWAARRNPAALAAGQGGQI